MALGCVPFIVAAFAPHLGIFNLPVIGNLQNAIGYYALAIVSYLAGMQWGISLMPSTEEQQPSYTTKMCPKRMMLASNIFVLVPWFYGLRSRRRDTVLLFPRGGIHDDGINRLSLDESPYIVRSLLSCAANGYRHCRNLSSEFGVYRNLALPQHQVSTK